MKPGKFVDVDLVYNPASLKDEDNIVLEIENGEERIIHCEGTSNETQCELTPKGINMGVIGVC